MSFGSDTASPSRSSPHTTRIGQRFLEALEADDFSALPAGPFAKGFIRSYCQALSESAEEALALYAAAIPREGPPARGSGARRARSGVSLPCSSAWPCS